jgi:tetratricopeptide (TPR) repeat protein
MKLSADDLTRLDEYILGRCPEAEQHAIRQLIATDEDWASAYRQQQSLVSGLGQAHLLQQLAHLKNLEKNQVQPGDLSKASPLTTNDEAGRQDNSPGMEEETPDVQPLRYHSLMQVARQLQHLEADQKKGNGTPHKGGRRRWLWGLGIAASVVLVVGLWPWLRPKTEGERLFESTFIRPEIEFQNRTSGDQLSIDSLQQLAYGAYITGKYVRSLKYFRKIGLREDPQYYQVFGTTLLFNDLEDEALKMFKEASIKWPNFTNWDQLIGFTFLKENKLEEARKYDDFH